MDPAQAIVFIRFIEIEKKPQIALRFFYKRKQQEINVVSRFAPAAPLVQILPACAHAVYVLAALTQRMLLVPDVACRDWSLP
jgi:hypothetical protein